MHVIERLRMLLLCTVLEATTCDAMPRNCG